jgi:hypothetical protein
VLKSNLVMSLLQDRGKGWGGQSHCREAEFKRGQMEGIVPLWRNCASSWRVGMGWCYEIEFEMEKGEI